MESKKISYWFKQHYLKGIRYFEKKKLRKAKREFKKALRYEKSNPEIFFMLGRIFMSYHLNNKTACKYFKKCYSKINDMDKELKLIVSDKKMRSFYSYMLTVAGIVLSINSYHEAIPSLELALKINPWNIDARNMLGVNFFWNGRFSDALQEFSFTYKLDDFCSLIAFNLSICLIAMDRINEAKDLIEEFLDRTITLSENNLVSHYTSEYDETLVVGLYCNLSYIYLQSGDFERVAGILKNVISKNYLDYDSYFIRMIVLACAHNGFMEEMRSLWEYLGDFSWYKCYKIGNKFERAIKETAELSLEKFLEIIRKEIEVSINFDLPQWLKERRYEPVEHYYSTGIYFGERGERKKEYLCFKKMFELAKLVLHSGAEVDKREYADMLGYGGAVLLKHDYEKGMECLKLAMEIDPQSFTPRFNLGVYYLNNGLYGEAMKIFWKLYEENKNDIKLIYNLYYVLADLRMYEDIIRVLENYLHDNPTDHTVMEMLAFSYYNLGRMDDAERTFIKITKLFPQSPVGHAGLALIYASQGYKSDAYSEVTKAINLSRNNKEYDVQEIINLVLEMLEEPDGNYYYLYLFLLLKMLAKKRKLQRLIVTHSDTQ